MDTIKNTRETVSQWDQPNQENITDKYVFHGFVKFWLWMVGILNVIFALIWLILLVSNDNIQPAMSASYSFFSLLCFISILTILQGYKPGFLMFLASSLTCYILQIFEESLVAIVSQLVGFSIGIIILWAITFKIRKNGIDFQTGGCNYIPYIYLRKRIIILIVSAFILMLITIMR